MEFNAKSTIDDYIREREGGDRDSETERDRKTQRDTQRDNERKRGRPTERDNSGMVKKYTQALTFNNCFTTLYITSVSPSKTPVGVLP